MTSPPILPPQLVAALSGNYELLQEIGRGGMGIVYAGRDVRLDRLVAIKVLPELVSSDEVRERFLREARAAARLSHPSIEPIYSADDRNGVTFMVMAFVDGTTLSTRLRDGNFLAPADAVPILRDVALALNAAHARGVIHRDIKPENILVDRLSGRAMVTDFGIARLADAMHSGALTRTGQVLGTVGYMSPEQVTGQELDGRSDLYSLGVVAFETLSGKLPFDGPAPVVIVACNQACASTRECGATRAGGAVRRRRSLPAQGSRRPICIRRCARGGAGRRCGQDRRDHPDAARAGR